jgi:hypothetical protein
VEVEMSDKSYTFVHQMVMDGNVGTVGILGIFEVNSNPHQTNPDGDWLLGILRNISFLKKSLVTAIIKIAQKTLYQVGRGMNACFFSPHTDRLKRSFAFFVRGNRLEMNFRLKAEVD